LHTNLTSRSRCIEWAPRTFARACWFPRLQRMDKWTQNLSLSDIGHPILSKQRAVSTEVVVSSSLAGAASP
jgi:hypothetical protein